VDTEADGSLLVTWELTGDPVPVDVGVGASPDRRDHRHEVTVPAGTTSWLLVHPGDGRLFVSVAPHGSGPGVVVTDRRVAFRGITNFRDLGGYRAGVDGLVRWGMVFRADGLHGLLPDDLSVFEQLGVRTVYDLRGDLERTENPNPVPSRRLSIMSRPAEADPPARTGLTAADGERILADVYSGVIDHSAAQIGELFTGLSEDEALPAVFHCHAGKDRTGVVAAILLEALGVPRPVVLDDYELSARYRPRPHQDSSYERLIRSGLSPEAAAGVLTTARWAMEEALGHLDAEYCGVEEYLTGLAGMRKEHLDALRARLLENAG
jgi:protein-tyrosine phosphatase